jgi:predicted O-methyltransferase YrrM
MTLITDELQARKASWSDIGDHLPRLYDEANRRAVRVLELGVRSGNSTAAFLAAAEANDGHVWSVDIAWAPLPEVWYLSGCWTFTIGDDLDDTIAAQQPTDVDVLFIDTSHHYWHTLAELELYVPRVTPGGVVLLHDTELDRPYDAPPDDPEFPVATAIREYAEAHDLEVEWVTGCYGLGVIRIPEVVA